MNNNILVPLIIILVLTLIFLIYYYSNKQIIIRTLSKLAHKPIGGLKTNDFTKVTGKALHVKAPLIAPYSKRKCIFYTVKIEEKRKTGKNYHWRTLIDEQKIQDFFVETDGDYVIIRPTQNPKNYKSHLVVDEKTASGTFNNPSPEFLALLKHYDINAENFFGFNKSLRYSEAIIEINEQITVAGIAKWKNLKEPIEGYSYLKIAELESSEKQKLIITDLPNLESSRRL